MHSCSCKTQVTDFKMSTKTFYLWYYNLFLMLFNLVADPCCNYQNLSDANRKSSYAIPPSGAVFCDDLPPEGWYRFVGAARTSQLFQSRSLDKLKNLWWNIGFKHLICETQKRGKFVLLFTIIKVILTWLRVRLFLKWQTW